MLPLMQTSTAFAPSPNPGLQSDNFAAFLARLAELPDWDSDPAVEPSGTFASFEPSEAGEEDLASLSYEHALRTPTRKARRAANRSGKSQSPQSVPKTALTIQPSPKALEPRPFEPGSFEVPKSLQIMEPRHARTTIRFTAGENKLLRKRAAENNIAVSAYIRSCVLEVESLRAQIQQVQQLMSQQSMSQQLITEPRSPAASRHSYSETEPQTPTLTAPPSAPALTAPQPPRPPMQPLTARAPQPASTLRLDPRVQAAFDAQKRISAQPSPALPEKNRSGFFSFLFGSRRRA
ncbi:plasmid mobilization protein [Terracidiphilus sp.]|uniref:plasmid mobilization protein n=1 Tax=Terracidiphilus sp. TaxID=1964191 RepID=UPI003C1343DB